MEVPRLRPTPSGYRPSRSPNAAPPPDTGPVGLP